MRGIKDFTVLCLLSAFLFFNPKALASEAVPAKPAELYIYDEAQVLSGETETYIIQKSGELQQKYGAQIVVYTAQSLPGEGYQGRVDYLRSVMAQWEIGGEQERGLILGLSVFDGDYEAVAGPGLSEEFTADALKSLLSEQLETDFAAGSYDAGIMKFFSAAQQKAETYLAAAPTPAPTEAPEGKVNLAKKKESGLGPLLWVLLAFGVIVVLCVAVSVVSGKRASMRSRHGVHRRNPVITPTRTTVTRLQETKPMVQIKAGDRSTGVYRDRRPRK